MATVNLEEKARELWFRALQQTRLIPAAGHAGYSYDHAAVDDPKAVAVILSALRAVAESVEREALERAKQACQKYADELTDARPEEYYTALDCVDLISKLESRDG